MVFGVLVIFLAAGLAVAAVGALLFFIRKPAGPAGSVVGFTRLVAIVAVVLLGLVNIWTVVGTLAGEGVAVTVPVQPYWPEHPNITDVYPERGDTVRSEITEVQVTSSTLTLTTRILLATGVLLQAAAVLAVVIAVIVLCNSLRTARPFNQSLRRTGRLTAAIIILGSLSGQIIHGIAASRAGEESLAVTGWAAEGLAGELAEPWPVPTLFVNVEFGPFFMALGILVLVELVGAGMDLGAAHRQLQADTDGLV